MNDNREFELFTEEELKKLDEKLQKAEKTELPESLSPENIENLIKDVPQDEIPVEETKPQKRNKKKIILSSISAAAAVIVAVTSIAVIRPWENKAPEFVAQDSVIGNPPKETQDYTEIEELFAGYAKKYKTYKYTYNYSEGLKGFGSVSSDSSAIEDGIIMENAVDMNASAPMADAQSGTAGVTNRVTENSINTSIKDDAEEGSQHGETNEQVKGVSEADIIKNDGKYLYLVNPADADWDKYYSQMESYVLYKEGLEATTSDAKTTPGYNPDVNSTPPMVSATEKETEPLEEEVITELPELDYTCEISIVEPGKKGRLEKINKIEIAKPENKDIYYMAVKEIYVEGNRLVAVVECSKRAEEEDLYEKYRYSYYGRKEKGVTMAVAYDISDRNNVKEEWRIFQDGYYISSRLIGDELVLLSNYYVDISQDVDVVKENCVPENSCDGKEFSRVAVNDICIMEDVYDTSYLVASVLDTDDKTTLKTEAVLGAGQNVYCTTEALYATSTEYDYNDARKAEVFGFSETVKTQIYKFDIRNYDIKYLKNASVDGSALNQFSMDEFNGYLRIATTSGSWGDSLVNQVYVLDSNLETVGLLKDIAKGETIKSVRFTGNTAYVVTFVQTDPLFVIDLTDVAAPKILGELKIPGYSSYLHPVGDGLVMGVGVDGTETGTNGGMKVSLFDVSDPTKPVECGKFTMSGHESEERQVYVESEAYYDHKALCWDAENKIMYIPYTKNVHIWAYAEGENYSKTTTGIVALKVNEGEKALKTAGEYRANTVDFDPLDTLSRATYIDNLVFGFSHYGGMLCSFDKNTQEEVAVLDVTE